MCSSNFCLLRIINFCGSILILLVNFQSNETKHPLIQIHMKLMNLFAEVEPAKAVTAVFIESNKMEMVTSSISITSSLIEWPLNRLNDLLEMSLKVTPEGLGPRLQFRANRQP